MTIPEAVELVLQSGTAGTGGEVFVLDMGAPVKIVDLARNMIELAGLEVGKDIRIQYDMLRPGEKLTEELVAAGEDARPTSIPKVLLHRQREKAQNGQDFLQEIATLEAAAMDNDTARTVATLWEIVRSHDGHV
jgi:FlaA1/EpsC-like NDP-sugar epimerase